jgi:hypothetical protein
VITALAAVAQGIAIEFFGVVGFKPLLVWLVLVSAVLYAYLSFLTQRPEPPSDRVNACGLGDRRPLAFSFAFAFAFAVAPLDKAQVKVLRQGNVGQVGIPEQLRALWPRGCDPLRTENN